MDYEQRSAATGTVREYAEALRGAMQAMGGQMAEACREPKVEVRPTGQTARIAGFPATRYDIFEDGKFTEELWVSRAITAWREIDPKISQIRQIVSEGSRSRNLRNLRSLWIH